MRACAEVNGTKICLEDGVGFQHVAKQAGLAALQQASFVFQQPRRTLNPAAGEPPPPPFLNTSEQFYSGSPKLPWYHHQNTHDTPSEPLIVG